MEAIFLSHNGLGDNITSISAVRFLLSYYSNIIFLCKDKHQTNCRLLFNNLNVTIIPFDSNNESQSCFEIISPYYNTLNIDIFISGYHKTYLKSKITNNDLLKYEQNDGLFEIEYDFIRQFYWDNNLDLSIYYTHFKINSCGESRELYWLVKTFNIYFTHTQSSTNKIDFPDYDFVNKPDWLVICANENVYDITSLKYDIANKFVNIPVAFYIDVILNANKIFVVDSCFSCIVYPLKKTNALSAETIKICNR